MPVNRKSLLWDCNVVVNRDLNRVSPVGFDKWTGKGPVDQENRTFVAVRGYTVSAYGKIISPDNPSKRSFFIVVCLVVQVTPGSAVRERVVPKKRWQSYSCQSSKY